MVPVNVAKFEIEHSPFSIVGGVIKVARDAYTGEGFNRKAFVDSFGKSVTGTVLLLLGAWLFRMGFISLKDDKEKDKDILALKTSMGLGNFQFNLTAFARWKDGEEGKQNWQDGDHLVTFDWLQPVAPIIVSGARFEEARASRDTSKADSAYKTLETFATATASSVDSLLDQPFLQGLKNFSSDKSVTENIANAFLQVPQSFVPTMLNQARKLDDNTKRTTKGETM
jgi:hypothetical protein